MADLGVQLFRLAFFVQSVEGLRASGIYTKFTNNDPDNTQNSRPQAGIPSPFLSSADGIVGDRAYSVQVTPGRIDLQVGCPDRPSAGPWAWKLDDGLKILQETVSGLSLELIRSLGRASVRVALNVQLLRNVASMAEASAILNERLDYAPFKDAMDIMVQLNKRTKATSTGTTLNRLLRFAISNVQEVIIGAQSGQQTVTNDRYLATLLIDINTALEPSSEFSPEQSLALLNEFVGRAVNIARDSTINAFEKDK